MDVDNIMMLGLISAACFGFFTIPAVFILHNEMIAVGCMLGVMISVIIALVPSMWSMNNEPNKRS